jgi:Cu(I)/Ag(I) efflux system membrane fusion protein
MTDRVSAMSRFVPALCAALVVTTWTATPEGGRSTSWPRPARAQAAEEKPASGLWTCGMHPQVVRHAPGTCPICNMQLVPLRVDPARPAQPADATEGSGDGQAGHYRHDAAGHAPSTATGNASDVARGDDGHGRVDVTIDPAIVQNMGVRVLAAEHRRLARTIYGAGFVQEWQPGIHDVTLRVQGWITHLYADTEGEMIRRGDPLLDVYAPELHVAVSELIAARKASQVSPASAAMSDVLSSARRKLELYGIDRSTVRRLEALEEAPESITIVAPHSGHVTHKKVVDGSAVAEGEHILRIVDHSRLWIDVELPQSQLALVSRGQTATARIDGAPSRPLKGDIVFVHPHVEPITRTGLVRLEVANPDMSLRPGMFARVEIQAELAASALAIPREAVLDSGVRQIVFLARDGGHFEPREVHVGPVDRDGWVQVFDGLECGSKVVTSGQFLIDTESRMREALARFLAGSHQH